MKRKLRTSDSAWEQFQTLQQVKGLSHAQGREIVQLLREDDTGHATCRTNNLKYPNARPLAATVTHATDAHTLRVHLNSLPDLVQAKVERCPLYAKLLEDAVQRTHGRLTLVLFADEAQPGNVLNVRQVRKSNLIYFSFLELEILFLESMWLPLSNTRAAEIVAHGWTYSEYTRCILEEIHKAVRDGFAVCFPSGDPWMIFLPHVMILMDHEGLRSMSGAKGSSGKKPCFCCTNVLGMQWDLPANHVSIAETDCTQFRLQTDAGLRATLQHLQSCDTRKELEAAEVALGRNCHALQNSCLNSPQLEDWIALDSLCFDSMHQYWSCGMVAQEIGLWYDAACACGISLSTLQTWLKTGWKEANGGTLHFLFSEKMFRPGQDFRGNAEHCQLVLPLLVAFSLEMLSACEAMSTAIASLEALYKVTRLLQDMKIDAAKVRDLSQLQAMHQRCFQAAYTAEPTRPKAHYARHLTAQVTKWKRHLDGFVGERKHKVFKSVIGPKNNNLQNFTKSCLLQLTEYNLQHGERLERMTGQLIGKPKPNATLALRARLPGDMNLSLGLEYSCTKFLRGNFVQITNTKCVEVLGSLSKGKDLFLIVDTLLRDLHDKSKMPVWNRQPDAGSLWEASKTKGYEPMRLVRQCQNKVWLLR